MKKILVFTLLVTSVAAMFCQEPNKKLQRLEEYLKQQGFSTWREQSSTWGRGITHEMGAGFNLYITSNPPMHESMSQEQREKYIHANDSLNAKRRIVMQNGLDSIRRTFATLGAEAAESHLYEYHKFGTDTIRYSLVFPQEMEEVLPDSFDFRDPEIANFYYHRYRDTKGDGGIVESASLNHLITMPSGIRRGDMKAFDIEVFEALILPELNPLMKKKGAKAYPVHWQHDAGFDDEVGRGLMYKATTWSSPEPEENLHTGLTTGSHYFIPARYEAEATALCQRLYSLALDYVNSHPEQLYNYQFMPSHFPYSGNLYEVVWGCDRTGSNGYYLCLMKDKEGFHILSLKNKGERWVPKDWQKLESYINGEKVYLKGMEPKEDKKEKNNNALGL